MPGPSRVTAARFEISIDGLVAAMPKLVEGGDAYGEVVEERIGPDGIAHKHLGAVRYSDIELTCGPDVTTPLHDWITASLGRSFLTKDGWVSVGDANFIERGRVTFSHAMLTEVGFPALDGASKDAAFLHLRLTPEYARRVDGSGDPLGPMPKVKGWVSSSFRLTIPDLDTKRTMRIEPLVVRLVRDPAAGELRDFEKRARLEVPNLVVTLADAARPSWSAWHEDFVINGNCGADREKSGTLELLGADMKSVIYRLDFSGLGIVSLSSVGAGRADELPRIRAEMYCEQIAVTFP